MAQYLLRNSLDEERLRQLHELYQGEWWSRGRELGDVRRVVEHSDLVFALCSEPDGALAAFARVLTDRVYKALIFDVIVAPRHRREGLGRRMMQEILEHPELRDVAHLELYCLPELVPFYRQWGFTIDVSGVLLMRRAAEP